MKLLIQHNQEIALDMSPDPFPLLRAGSGDETTPSQAFAPPEPHFLSRYTPPADRITSLLKFRAAAVTNKDFLVAFEQCADQGTSHPLYSSPMVQRSCV